MASLFDLTYYHVCRAALALALRLCDNVAMELRKGNMMKTRVNHRHVSMICTYTLGEVCSTVVLGPFQINKCDTYVLCR